MTIHTSKRNRKERPHTWFRMASWGHLKGLSPQGGGVESEATNNIFHISTIHYLWSIERGMFGQPADPNEKKSRVEKENS